MTFPEKLRELRKTNGLSQGDVGELIGIHFMSVSRWERGEAMPPVKRLMKLALLFSVSMDELLCVNEGVDDPCHTFPRQ